MQHPLISFPHDFNELKHTEYRPFSSGNNRKQYKNNKKSHKPALHPPIMTSCDLNRLLQPATNNHHFTSILHEEHTTIQIIRNLIVSTLLKKKHNYHMNHLKHPAGLPNSIDREHGPTPCPAASTGHILTKPAKNDGRSPVFRYFCPWYAGARVAGTRQTPPHSPLHVKRIET